jgi:hypothetical protein
MSTKIFRLTEVEYSTIMSALADYATKHFDKSKTLKTEDLIQYHKEVFQKAMDAQFELREQKNGQL